VIKHRPLVATLGCLAALGGAGVAVAADGATDIKVTTAPTLSAGQTAPFDAAGVKAVRRGKPIPAGYVLVGQTVDIQRGAKSAGAALTFRCPGTTRLRTCRFGDHGISSTPAAKARTTPKATSPSPISRVLSTIDMTSRRIIVRSLWYRGKP